MEFLITTIAAVILLVGVVSSCPSVCSCTENANGLDVDCSSRELDKIPTDLPTNTYSFKLHVNQITSIEVGAFNHLTSLADLYLNSNQITSIQEGTFNNLTSLTQLYLSYNLITSIQEGTFNNLKSLTYLYLHFNQITSIQEGIFKNLTNLSYLSLYSSKITSIQSGAFNDLPRLTRLLLRSNPISFVSENAFQNIPQLTSLEFHMHCDNCDNVPFWRWLKLNQKFSSSVTCYDYDGELMFNLQLNNFTDCFSEYLCTFKFSKSSNFCIAGYQ